MAQFIPAADEVGRLQRGDDSECQFFKGFMDEGHYAGRTQPTPTRQGIYAVTPGGDFLASVNTRRPKEMVAMLEQALLKWSQLDADARQGTEFEHQEDTRFERFYPEHGLILRCTSRDLQEDDQLQEGDWRRKAWNTDFAWFRAQEVLSMIPEAFVGATRKMPKPLLERLICLHLLDTVRGQTPAFRPAEVERSELTLEVTGRDGAELLLSLKGHTRAMRHKDPPGVEWDCGVEFQLLGRARFSEGRFTQFELLAVGTSTGRTRYNGRDGKGSSPLGIALVLDS
ncbi:MAG: hypothetical protein ACI9F9_003036, partial [Candidatus Paceibacteria bacterium]